MYGKNKLKLIQALELIESTIKYDKEDLRIPAVWLSVAADYCRDVAKELKDEHEKIKSNT